MRVEVGMLEGLKQTCGFGGDRQVGDLLERRTYHTHLQLRPRQGGRSVGKLATVACGTVLEWLRVKVDVVCEVVEATV